MKKIISFLCIIVFAFTHIYVSAQYPGYDYSTGNYYENYVYDPNYPGGGPPGPGPGPVPGPGEPGGPGGYDPNYPGNGPGPGSGGPGCTGGYDPNYQGGGPGGPGGCVKCFAQPGCYPSAPICGSCCGLSVCAIAFAIALVAGVAVLVVTLSHETSHVHAPTG